MNPWEGAPVRPRAWQAEAIPAVLAAVKQRQSPLVAAVMGSGKSRVQAELCWLALPKRGERAIVVVAPRQNLVRQLYATVAERCPSTGMYYADTKQADKAVIVCCGASLPSLRVALGSRKVSLLIVDEAHNSEASILHEEVGLLAPRVRIGFTATPFRTPPRESLTLWDCVAYRYTMQDALRDGVLVNFRHVRYEGLLTPGSVDAVCLDMMKREADGPGIVSAYSIPDAESYAAFLTNQGFEAMAIHSRLSDEEQEKRIDALRAGEVRALVHVALLAEGVDFPWLRWLCLRRLVQARVRFFQEIGRPLRVHPGKTEAVIMDPHLLLGRHGLTTAEAIGAALDEIAEQDDPDLREAKQAEAKEKEVVALDLLTSVLEQVHGRLVQDRVIAPPSMAPGAWQFIGASEKQVERIKALSKLTRHVSATARPMIKALVHVPWALSRGQAAMLMDVLLGGRKWADVQSERQKRPAYAISWSDRFSRDIAPSAEQVAIVEGMR